MVVFFVNRPFCSTNSAYPDQMLHYAASHLGLCCLPIRETFFYVRREVDVMKTAKVNAYIMHIFGKIELLSIHAT